MNPRFVRLATIWTLALATLWLGERLYRAYWLSDEAPRVVVPAGKLSDWEDSTIALFRAAAPSVAYITTERLRFNPYLGVGVSTCRRDRLRASACDSFNDAGIII